MSEEFDIATYYMRLAIKQAQEASDEGEVPVGAVIVHEKRVVGQARNQVELLKDPTAHAEILAITQAANALGDWRLNGAALYVTKEPCPMCAGAIVQARISRVIWGMTDPQRGGAKSRFDILDNPALNHRAEMSEGVLEAECRAIMLDFFRRTRASASGTSAADICPDSPTAIVYPELQRPREYDRSKDSSTPTDRDGDVESPP